MRIFPAILLPLLLLGHSSAVLAAGQFYYAYFGDQEGGVAELTVDPEKATILKQQKVFHSPGNPKLERLIASPDHNYFALSNTLTEARSIYLLKNEGDTFSARRRDLPQRADFLVCDETLLAAVGHKSALYQVELNNPDTIKKSLNVAKLANTKGGALGKAVLTPDGSMLAALVGENDDDGTSPGGRVLLFSWPQLELLHDIKIPRQQAALHYSPGSTQRNPMPVDIAFFPAENTVAILLELYGAVAFADLDDFQKGKLKNFRLLATAQDNKFGSGFPTKLFPLTIAGSQYLLADNAGGPCGAALFDVAARTRLAWLDTGPSSLGFCQMLDEQTAVATRAGVKAKRGYQETEYSHSEQQDLITIDFRPLATKQPPEVKKIQFDDYVYFCHPLNSTTKPLVLIGFFGKRDQQLTLGVYDLQATTLTDRQPTIGVIRGFIPAR